MGNEIGKSGNGIGSVDRKFAPTKQGESPRTGQANGTQGTKATGTGSADGLETKSAPSTGTPAKTDFKNPLQVPGSGAKSASTAPSGLHSVNAEREASQATPAQKVAQALEHMVDGTNYRIKAADGKLRLERTTAPLHAYLITIHPATNDLTKTNLKDVGSTIGELLHLLESQQNTNGGIKSVTFSNHGGSMVYHNDPAKKFSFGGGTNEMNVSGDEVRRLLGKLEHQLAQLASEGFSLTAHATHSEDKSADAPKLPNGGGAIGAEDEARKAADAEAKQKAAERAAEWNARSAAGQAAKKKKAAEQSDKPEVQQSPVKPEEKNAEGAEQQAEEPKA